MHHLIAPAIAALFMQSAALNTEAASAIFGARPQVEQASLSPDGTKIAYVKPLPGQGSAVYVAPLDGSAKERPALVAKGDPERMGKCSWAASSRLLCDVYSITLLQGGELAYVDRWVGVDIDGNKMQVLFSGREKYQNGYSLFGGSVIDWLPAEDGHVLMMREYVPEYAQSFQVSSKDGIGVDRVDTRSGRVSSIETPLPQIVSYLSDGQGHVRIKAETVTTGGGYDKGTINWFYRKKESSRWEELGSTDSDGNGFLPRGLDSDEDAAYGLKKLDGRVAAYKIALDGSKKLTLVYAHPQVDVDSFIRVGRNQRIVGVTFATDRRQSVYFDPQLATLAKALSRAIPKLPLIEFVDSSLDGSRLLIWAGSDTDPGRYYLFDRTTKHLDDLMDVRPELTQVPLAPVQAVTYKAKDGTLIPAYLTLPPGKAEAKGLPAIVMPHGGPESRDEWGFDWLSQYFANRGYAVLQPNFRGSAGYGESWFVENGFQSWRTAIGDVDDGGRWLITEGIADPKKLAIFGWSYGGYAALQSAVAEPGLFGAVVAVAPVTDLELLKNEWKNWSNYRVTSAFIGSGDHITQGSPARNAAQIKVPVLMFHGTFDRNVNVKESRLMDSRLKDAGGKSELVVYEMLDHQVEDGKARADMLAKSDAFLRASLGL